jgi:UDP-N-acetylglucosamine--N-acetylmuramyl-(pentapeptide) pyrophosphoryl-undecaprenol N-acetylglucosamine transferase
MPALAMAEAVLQAEPAWRAVFAGAERGVEATVLPMRGVEHRLFPFAPIYRRQWWRNFQWPALAFRLVREVDAFLDEARPDAVIGSGGYVSGPVVWRAARRGIERRRNLARRTGGGRGIAGTSAGARHGYRRTDPPTRSVP